MTRIIKFITIITPSPAPQQESTMAQLKEVIHPYSSCLTHYAQTKPPSGPQILASNPATLHWHTAPGEGSGDASVFSNRVASTRGGWFFSDNVYHFFLGVPLIFGAVFKIITANPSPGENRGCRPAAVFPGQSWDAAQFGGLPHLAPLSTKCCHLHTVLPKRKCNWNAEPCISPWREKFQR